MSRPRFKSVLSVLIVIIIVTILVQYYKLSRGRNLLVSIPDAEFAEGLALDPNVLVNLTNFRYVIESSVCDRFDDNEQILGIIVVTSYVGHDELRSAHRQSMSQADLMKMGLARVFLLSEIPPTEKFITQDAIVQENRIFGDLVQGNFIENYRNLTYKHVMGLKWASEKCSSTKFIIKMDDDIVYDVYFLQNYLVEKDMEVAEDKNFLGGFILKGGKVIRNQANKWFVSERDYPGSEYPDYLSGWLYITTPFVARTLVRTSQSRPFFWIDDTYVTGILADAVNIELTRLNSWFSANSEFLECCIKDAVAESLNCDYHVGPNGGENKMLIRFTKAMAQCQDDFCADRHPENSLKMTCIGQVKEIVRDHGEAVLRPFRL